ncbi:MULTISPECIES: DNA-3-methyladenine glycosylase family protein [Alphaproteobacteria]|uniref:DNA-3-methyladenine glycosylase II n=2 Tax=Alphaproteobacteria TaxID=28211 RepID=A0A512HLL1_9HYPH|nr:MULTISPECIES: DNA-3-methyladenine glycosylase [Alphaproteobacteria]GEO86336.1 DNA-3-methyladenine glycosidase [Ciceribacter naphthalenivorans]GLR21818.1 DNA-3-methyladenine glycosidase [Ciceribacter naphthalenivorans]GLT04674.1 DNA-3-methyladenine glycosidase [Sphingomonas psychrolutea]
MIITTADHVALGLLQLVAIDPRLEPLAHRHAPLPLRLTEPGFAGLAHIIVSQMVSRASAEAIWSRILEATGEAPSAQTYLALDAAVVAGLGLSRAKASTLEGVARAVASNALDLSVISSLDADEAITRLTALKGIGLWTAEVYLMFCCGHPDVFPAGDVALRAAVGDAFGHEARPDIRTVAELAEAWRPWRSIAARLFWAYYAARTGREAAPAGA